MAISCRDSGQRFRLIMRPTADSRFLRHAGPPQLASDPNHPVILWKFIEISIMYYGKFSRSAPLPDRAGRLSARRKRERQRRLDLRPLPSVGRRPPEANEQASERTGRRSEAPTKPRQTMPDAVRSRTAGLTESQEPLEATEKDRLQFFSRTTGKTKTFLLILMARTDVINMSLRNFRSHPNG